MADIDWTNVTNFAPELSTVSAGAQADILALVNTAFAVAEFDGEDGPVTKLARIYYAAHLGTLVGSGAAGGLVASESAGGLSRSYVAGGSTTSGDLAMTAYGRLLRGMMGRYAGGPRVI